jgi:hypothetical protein
MRLSYVPFARMSRAFGRANCCRNSSSGCSCRCWCRSWWGSSDLRCSSRIVALNQKSVTLQILRGYLASDWVSGNCATHFTNEETSKWAVIVGEVAKCRRASRQSQLHAILQSLSVAGLSRCPIDGRVAKIWRRRAPPEVERAPLVVARCPEHLIWVPHVNCNTYPLVANRR